MKWNTGCGSLGYIRNKEHCGRTNLYCISGKIKSRLNAENALYHALQNI
jgi:hypothetical protein